MCVCVCAALHLAASIMFRLMALALGLALCLSAASPALGQTTTAAPAGATTTAAPAEATTTAAPAEATTTDAPTTAAPKAISTTTDEPEEPGADTTAAMVTTATTTKAPAVIQMSFDTVDVTAMSEDEKDEFKDNIKAAVTVNSDLTLADIERVDLTPGTAARRQRRVVGGTDVDIVLASTVTPESVTTAATAFTAAVDAGVDIAVTVGGVATTVTAPSPTVTAADTSIDTAIQITYNSLVGQTLSDTQLAELNEQVSNAILTTNDQAPNAVSAGDFTVYFDSATAVASCTFAAGEIVQDILSNRHGHHVATAEVFDLEITPFPTGRRHRRATTKVAATAVGTAPLDTATLAGKALAAFCDDATAPGGKGAKTKKAKKAKKTMDGVAQGRATASIGKSAKKAKIP